MNESALAALGYDRRTVVLHWLTAALVMALWALGQTIDFFPKGDPRVLARSVHITLGVVLAVVLVRRIAWRLGAGSRLPPAGAGLPDTLAIWVHKALYVLLIGAVLLGLANAWVRGDNLFNLFTVPAFSPGDKALRETVEGWHGTCADALLILAALHAAAALWHHFARRDGVLQRMRLPR